MFNFRKMYFILCFTSDIFLGINFVLLFSFCLRLIWKRHLRSATFFNEDPTRTLPTSVYWGIYVNRTFYQINRQSGGRCLNSLPFHDAFAIYNQIVPIPDLTSEEFFPLLNTFQAIHNAVINRDICSP